MHADTVRELSGTAGLLYTETSFTGAFYEYTRYHSNVVLVSGGASDGTFKFPSERVIPTGDYTAPRAFGTLACVYLGA